MRMLRYPLKHLETVYRYQWRAKSTSISTLQAAFRDPSSPFYLAPGTTGPESPDSLPTAVDYSTSLSHNKTLNPIQEAQLKMGDAGFDPASFWEQPIVWGDHDAFQHVNNVRYARFFESGRIKWMMSLGHELGGPAKAEAMIKGQGVSLILKSIEVQFRRPVTFPDTLLIAYHPCLPPSHSRLDPATFHVTGSAYSIAQRAFVADSNEVLVWYDYDKLRKCDPGEAIRELVRRRMKKDGEIL